MSIFKPVGRRKPDPASEMAPDGAYRAEPGRPARLVQRSVMVRAARRLAWSVVVLGAMAGTTHLLLEPPAFLLAAPPKATTAAPGWTDIRKPFQAFAISGGTLEGRQTGYWARRHGNGSRIDTIRFGDFGGAGSERGIWMRLKVHRIADNSAPLPALFVEMARVAADEGLSVSRMQNPDLLQSRFGSFAVTDLVASGEGIDRPCIGYRLRVRAPSLELSGIACGNNRNPVDRRQLGCMLDRLDVVAARDDSELRRFFARTELDRAHSCPAAKTAGMRNRAFWIDRHSAEGAIKALRLKPAGR